MATAPCSICGSKEGPDHLCPGQNAQLVGQVLAGKYQIEEILGQGGMGMVFRAVNTSLQLPVAVKTLHPQLATAPQFFERFRREAQIASSLRHPNIINIFDFGREPDGTCYYVMELLQGQSVKQLVKGSGAMSLRRASDIIEQVSRGLGHAHSSGAIHRDIKPHNIMVSDVDGGDLVKLLDFGLVKALEQEEGEQLTSTGQVLGTPQYMPPEQAGGEHVDHRSDLYSLACVFFYCLTGQTPFNANSVRKALQAALSQPVPGVNTIRQGAPVPRSLDEFFRKGLAAERDDRHQSCEEFVEDFRNALAECTDEQLDALPTGTVEPSRESGSGSRSSGRRAGSASHRAGSGASSRPSSKVQVDRGAMTISRPHAELPAERPPPERVPAPKGGLSTGMKVGLVLGPVLVFGAAAGVVLSMDRPPPEPELAAAVKPAVPVEAPKGDEPEPSEQTPARSMVVVKLSATPDGVEVYEGGALIGLTPMELKLSRDQEHSFIFKREGFVAQEKKLDLSRWTADSMDVAMALKPVARTAGSPGRRGGDDPPKKGDDISIFE